MVWKAQLELEEDGEEDDTSVHIARVMLSASSLVNDVCLFITQTFAHFTTN
ncbi:MAG: hypothetical protein SFZ02_04675 [bacterium]|nr:hypothetical protein [bacterium]